MNSVTPDATSAVLAENRFNDPPRAGYQFFIANISATYTGDDESSSLLFDISVRALGPSAVAYRDFEDSCGVIPGELDEFVDVFQGGTVSGNVCWQVRTADASELVMYVEESFSLDDRRVWLALFE